MWIDKISRLLVDMGKSRAGSGRGSADEHQSRPDEVKFFQTWDEARATSKGYENAVILDRVLKAALAVKRGEACFERDSVAFAQPGFRWQMLACVASAAAANKGELHVMDFGGSLASVYLQHLRFFERWPNIKWSIVEQQHFVDAGRRELQDDRLRFFPTIAEVAARDPISMVIFASSLQYVRDPCSVLEEAIGHCPAHIVIDRIPLTQDEGDRVVVEEVPEEIFPSSYPLWLLSERKLITFLEGKGYLELARYVDGIDPEGYVGICFEKRRC